MKKIYLFLLVAILWSCTETSTDKSAAKDGYDLVILNGRVMDPETNFDEVRNVGIIGDKIVAITQEDIRGKETIDATGHVVCPGFVDTHAHAMDPLSNKLYLRNGVTSAMDLEYGSLDINKFYDDRAKNGSLVNYGTAVSHEYARIAVLDGVVADECTNVYKWRTEAGKDGESSWAVVTPDSAQRDLINDWMRKGLDEGALTACSTVGYFGGACTSEEVWDIQKLAWDEYQRGYSSHTRMLPNDGPPVEYHIGIKEAFANAAALGAPFLISHNNNNGWWEVNEMARRARAQGMLIWTEQYPYAAGAPNVGAPPISVENLAKWGMTPEKNMYDPERGRFYTTEEYLDDRKNNPAKAIIWYARPIEWVNRFVAEKEHVIITDALPMVDENNNWLPVETPYEDWKGHPRVAGTYAKCLRIAREDGVPLMNVVNNAGAFNALMLRKSGINFFDKRGSIQEGFIADITIFDPETVTDNSDYAEGKNGLASTGIPYVLISGKFAVRDSKVDLEMRAGQPIRHEVIGDNNYDHLFEAAEKVAAKNSLVHQHNTEEGRFMMPFTGSGILDCSLH